MPKKLYNIPNRSQEWWVLYNLKIGESVILESPRGDRGVQTRLSTKLQGLRREHGYDFAVHRDFNQVTITRVQ